ncbi:MAG: DNA repair protein RecN [Alphaproteobacteria bacterium]|nr:DNA repair protein RecN [Alphaproteobacteria bacterium]
MLTRLSIRNIVLIAHCDLAFAPGLSVLTGETGAGKSILLDALGLALGARSEAGLLRHGEHTASVSAEFDIPGNPAAEAVLESLGLEKTEALILRRTIGADGKSRAFINDQPVSAAALKRLGEVLVEVQGQHDQRGLLDPATHRAVLDAYGGHAAALAATAHAYAAWKEAAAALAAAEAEEAQMRREEEYLRHIAAELSALAPQTGEEARLSERRLRMMQSEKLFETLNNALSELGGDAAPSQRLRGAQRHLARSALNADGRFNGVIEWLDKAAEAADEAQAALEALGQAAEYNPATLETVEERLFALKAAARKYKLEADELPALRGQTEARLKRLDAGEVRRKAALAAEHAAREAYCRAAEALGALRRKTAVRLEKAIAAELTPLKMGNTHFRVGFTPLPAAQWGSAGMETVTFEAATNIAKGGDIPFAALHKIASGGELSRFLLALRVCMREASATPTLIFDEIDSGTGGAVADAIGQRLSRLSETAQVLVVTHLPQVAARGVQHLVVSKEESGGQISTKVQALTPKQRKEELARMLSGRTITAEARKAAEKLLETAA